MADADERLRPERGATSLRQGYGERGRSDGRPGPRER